ncbi:MAG TPA: YncE family protein [Terriglobales bacterium]|jgi:DNA-binding beta-propeller fold protein YncE|nr:YncE family protein [Terriglobales bacterium]
MKRTVIRCLRIYCVVGLLVALALADSAPSGYHLIQTIQIGAAEGDGEYFDYITVDDADRRIYIAHGTEVKVLNADDLSVVGTIVGFKRCHGVLVVRELGRGFVTDGDAGNVAVFSTESLKVTRLIKTYPDADGIVYDPASKLIFAFNGDSKNASVIDPVKETVVKTLDMGGGPEQSVADGQGTIYNNNEETSEIVVIDTRALIVKSRWPVAPSGEPVAMAMDREHKLLFSAGRNPQMLLMVNTDNGKVLQSLPITAGVDTTIYDSETSTVFCSTRQGMIHVFHKNSQNRLSVVGNIRTQYGAKTMAMDPKSHNLILVTSDFTASGTRGERHAIKGTARVLIYGR